ncbi:unnamed protein product, partial [Ectocarpus sp. 12 AP-2014]
QRPLRWPPCNLPPPERPATRIEIQPKSNKAPHIRPVAETVAAVQQQPDRGVSREKGLQK